MNNELAAGLLPFIDACIFQQGAFLCVLWAMLFMGWLAREKNFPEERKRGGKGPGQVQVGLAAFIGAIVLLVCMAGFQASHWLLGLALAMGVFVSVLDPGLALCFTVSMLLMRPWEIMGENPVVLLVPRFSTIFSFAWAAHHLVVTDKMGLRWNRFFTWLAAFAGWALLAAFVTPVPSDAVKTYTDFFIPVLMLIFLVNQLVRGRFAVWALKLTLMVVLTCAGFISIYFYYSGYRVTGRLIGFGLFANSNDIAAVMTILLGLAGTVAVQAKGARKKFWPVFASLIALLVVVYAQSRGAMMAVGAGGAAVVLQRVRNKAAALLLIAAVGITGQAAMSLLVTRDQADLGGSTSSRTIFWVAGLRMAMINPMFGVGFNEYLANVEQYWTEEPEDKGAHTAHSTWILCVAETGILGLIFYAGWFWLGAIKPAIQLSARDPSWLYAVVMYGVAITFLSHTFFIFPFLLASVVTVAYGAEAAMAKAAASRSRRGASRVLTTRAGLPASTLLGG